jgi:Tol biopolymer transport system component
MTLGRRLAGLVVVLCAAQGLRAQVVPNAHWRTIDTKHFHVHFTPALEPAARRAAVSAERAYARLATELVEPRGPIDLVIADNVDFANGSTTPFPTNRVIVYAHPPLDDLSLRFYDDWLALVITHELTHVFHLDRTRGWWRFAQRIFGRSPALFPNVYLPGWVTEGLAVYYESDLTGFGRVEGTYEPMIITSTAHTHGMLGIDKWSLSTTRYPYGDIAYGDGALFMDYLARTRGAPSIGRFIERSSGTTIPFRLNHMARQGFGISFSEARKRWADSVVASTQQERPPMPDWHDVTTGGYFVGFPRWGKDGSLLYVSSNGHQSPALQRVRTDGSIERLSRRNGESMNVPLPDGSVVYSQLDLVTPYEDRYDLYREKNGHVSRLTHGARLTSVDARADGEIIAVRFDPGTTTLVRVSPDGSSIRALTSASPDTEWAEPKWSRRGDRIAATRWTRGGYTQIVVLDTLGHVLRELTRDRASNSHAEWAPGDAAIVYASDRTGVSQLYAEPVAGDVRAPAIRLTDVTTGVFWPAISPDGESIAAVRWESDGYHVGVAPLGRVLQGPTGGAVRIAKADSAADTTDVSPAPASTAQSHGYSPWRSLLPRYWLPLVGQNSFGGYTVGAYTSGSDVVNRHAYAAQVLFDFARAQHTAEVSYSYAGLGQPVLQANLNQYWDVYRVLDSAGSVAGDLFRRTRDFELGATFSRPRVRTNAFLSVFGTYEARDYTTDPAPLISRIAGLEDPARRYWILSSSAGWSNAQASALSISPEDGVSMSASGRLKWLDGGGPLASKNVSAAVTAYKSIDAGAFARHVIALRAAAGVAGGTEQNEFDLGGASGANIAALPGLSLGVRRTFAVRGFPVGVESGTRIVAGSAEYRVPFTRNQHGFGLWPVFLDRTSLSLFGDAGSASGGFGTTGSLADNWIASAGAELGINLAVPYDVPYLLRIGIAAPVVNHSGLDVSSPSVYVRLGFSF